MKNFRKVLALILVVATLFSFVAMASAKTSEDYSDASDIYYVEAVDVLSAVGILEGYDGAYHPLDNIDRDEMAKMIAVLRNGGEDNSALFSGANKFADVKGSWAEGYIAYCTQLGIVAGRNATTFDPDGKVTGVEVLKMLLCVLGYDAEEQGYLGTNWATNVLRDATKMGLMEGLVDFNAYDAASRDEAAQMMLNALKASLVVGYVSESLVKVTNSIYLNVADEDDSLLDISINDAEKDGWEVAYCNAVISRTPLYTVIKGLDCDFARDCFGRPGYEWTYAPVSKEVFSKLYTLEADVTMTAPTSDDMEDATEELSSRDASEWNYFIDGKKQDTAIAAMGNGSLLEIYNYTVNGESQGDVVLIYTYIDEVVKVSEHYNYFQLSNGAKYRLNDRDIEKEDLVLYHLCEKDGENNVYGLTVNYTNDKDLHDVTVVEPVVVNVEAGYAYDSDIRYNPNGDYIVADGETYKYSFKFADSIGAPTEIALGTAGNSQYRLDMADINKYGDEWDLYLDEYGYIMYLEPHTEENFKYVVVEEDDVTRNYLGTKTNPYNGNLVDTFDYTAKVAAYGEDGTIEAVETEIDEKTFEYMIELGTKYNDLSGKGPAALVAFDTATAADEADGYEVGDPIVAKDENGRYMFGAFATSGTVLDNENFALKDGEVYANSKTIFMIRTLTGDKKNPYAYEQVTGYKNLPGVFVAQDLTYPGATTYTNIQYFVDEDYQDFATYVFIDARYTDGAEYFMLTGKAAYAVGFETKYTYMYGKDFKAWDAIVDGEKSILLADPDAVATYYQVDSGKVTVDDDVLMPGFLYEDSLVYLGIEMTMDGKTYPVYAFATEAEFNACGAVEYKFVVADDEIYVKIGGYVYEVAEDATWWTLVANGPESAVQAIPYYVNVDEEADDLTGWIPNEDLLDPDLDEDVYNDYMKPVTDSFYKGYVVFDKYGEKVTAVFQISENSMSYWFKAGIPNL